MDQKTAYAEAKDDLQAISEPLFGFAEQQVQEQGAFLPFGAMLDRAGQVVLQAAATDDELPDVAGVLSLLHEGLRATAQHRPRAVAVCEWVKIALEGQARTDAVKVLVEHANGLVVALYLPMRKRLLGKWRCGEMLSVAAEPEVGLFRRPPA